MFERWTKARNSPPVVLDLVRHLPDEFQGKSVSVGGRDYLIGARLKQSDQGYTHRLTNTLSGLCLMVIQIRPEYQKAPESAWLLSKTKQDATADMRNHLRSQGKETAVPVSVVTAYQAHGGSFEVHEVHWGTFGNDHADPSEKQVLAALAAMEKGDLSSAIRMLEAVLLQCPQHSSAWLNLAGAYQAQGHDAVARDAVDKAVVIEPNYNHYRGAQIQLAVNSRRPRTAVVLFERFKEQFPHVGDFDLYGIHAWLRAGLPQRASDLLLSASLPAAQRDELGPEVDSALSARKRFDQISLSRLDPTQGADPVQTLQELESLHAQAQTDPYIGATLGLALREAGQYQRAASLVLSAAGGIEDRLLPHCWANAAYCLIYLSDWNRAFPMLSATMDALCAGDAAEVKAADVPGLASWVTGDGMVLESIHPSAFEVLSGAIAACPDRSLITADIQRMAVLLQQFASEVA